MTIASTKKAIATIIVVTVIMLTDFAVRYWSAKTERHSWITDANIQAGILSVKEVLNHVSHEVTFRVPIDTGVLEKTLFKVWKF